MECWHWCRSGGGHDWCHQTKTGTEQLDNFRLFCATHGAAVASQILSTGTVDDTRTISPTGVSGTDAESSRPHDEDREAGRVRDRFALACGAEAEAGGVRSALSVAFAAADDLYELQVLP
jgi:hypothetical protein